MTEYQWFKVMLVVSAVVSTALIADIWSGYELGRTMKRIVLGGLY